MSYLLKLIKSMLYIWHCHRRRLRQLRIIWRYIFWLYYRTLRDMRISRQTCRWWRAALTWSTTAWFRESSKSDRDILPSCTDLPSNFGVARLCRTSATESVNTLKKIPDSYKVKSYFPREGKYWWEEILVFSITS